MLDAFAKWIERFGSRPWQGDLQKAFEAGYRAGLKHDATIAGRNRSRNPAPIKRKPAKRDTKVPKPPKPHVDKLLERLKGEQR